MGDKQRAANLTKKYIERLRGVDDPLAELINFQFERCSDCGHFEDCTSYICNPAKRNIEFPFMDEIFHQEKILLTSRVLKANTDREQRVELIKDFLDIADFHEEDMVDIFEESFSGCFMYNHVFSYLGDEGYQTMVRPPLETDDIEDRPQCFQEVVDELDTLENEYAKKFCMAIHIIYSKCGNCRIRMEHGSRVLDSVVKKLEENIDLCL